MLTDDLYPQRSNDATGSLPVTDLIVPPDTTMTARGSTLHMDKVA
jgi:hypothetical protein